MSIASLHHLRLLVSPLKSSVALQAFAERLLAAPHIQTATMERFQTETAEFAVITSSVGDLIGTVLGFEGMPLAALTITATGEVTIRLQRPDALTPMALDDLPERAPVQSSALRTEPEGAAAIEHARLERLRQSLNRTLAQLTDLAAGAPASIVLPRDLAVAQPGRPDPEAPPLKPIPTAGGEAGTKPDPIEEPMRSEAGDHTSRPEKGSGQQPGQMDHATGRALRVVAYPFENPTVVERFINALSNADGIGDVAAQPLLNGALQLTVEYASPVPLAERLAGMAEFAPRIVADDGDSVTIALGRFKP